MPLHLDYRPQNLNEFLGNEETKAALKLVIEDVPERRPRTLLFSGMTGCGKTTLARIVAQEVGCSSDFDFQELNAASVGSADKAREIERNIRYRPIAGKTSIILLDECQSSTPKFWENMLKPLEDTPEWVMFLLCTTEPEKLKPTIRSRCMEFKVSPLRAAEIRSLLRKVLKAEGVEEFPDEALDKISQVCEGIPRNALVLLNKVIDIVDNKLLLEAIDREVINLNSVNELCHALLSYQNWDTVRTILKNLQDEDPEGLRVRMLNYFNKVLLDKNTEDKWLRAGFVIEVLTVNTFMYHKHAGLSLACYQVVMAK